jgi:hypothetical protein
MQVKSSVRMVAYLASEVGVESREIGVQWERRGGGDIVVKNIMCVGDVGNVRSAKQNPGSW